VAPPRPRLFPLPSQKTLNLRPWLRCLRPLKQEHLPLEQSLAVVPTALATPRVSHPQECKWSRPT
jgi:hypothetical protein